jgi:hypothetical protein
VARTQHIFDATDRDELLNSLAVARAGCVKALTKLPAGRTVSEVECLMGDIDELAAYWPATVKTSSEKVDVTAKNEAARQCAEANATGSARRPTGSMARDRSAARTRR